MIAGLTPALPVCRMCGYRCGIVATGCGYDDESDYGKWGPPRRRVPSYATTTVIMIPLPPVDEPLVEPLPRRPTRPQKRIAPTEFVGGGAMRRRWR